MLDPFCLILTPVFSNPFAEAPEPENISGEQIFVNNTPNLHHYYKLFY